MLKPPNLSPDTGAALTLAGSGAAGGGTSGEPLRVAILYKRHLEPDETLMKYLEALLVKQGCRVFIDRKLAIGVDWAKEIEREVRTSDAVLALLSAGSILSEMLSFEVEIAYEAAQKQNGRPRLLPIRVQYEGPLPELMAGILNPIQYQFWHGAEDDAQVGAEVLRGLLTLPPKAPPAGAPPPAPRFPRVTLRTSPAAKSPPSAGAMFRTELEPVGGAVPLGSSFYIERQTDAEFRAALIRNDSIILVKGARQMGKTSLLARGLQQARERGAKVALTDCQKLNSFHLESVQDFFLYLAESITDQLEIEKRPENVWDERRGASVNFERYLRREVLRELKAPLVWGLDEVDRLFSCSFGSEVFGLFRSWHNERALDPLGPWAGLTLAIAYATEAHLFITDMNQSPFNVGTRLTMDDFSPEQVAELNRRYGSPLRTADELNRFVLLARGHPFLVRRGLHEMVTQRTDIAQFEAQADGDDGIYGDHLRRILILLAKDPALAEVVRGVLRGQPCPTPDSFYRLRSAGVMAGTSPADVHPRCELYARFLKRHLL